MNSKRGVNHKEKISICSRRRAKRRGNMFVL